MKLAYPVAMLLSLTLLSACGKKEADNEVVVKEEVTSSISSTLNKASEEARREIIKGNMHLSAEGGVAKAEITPQGDLLIGGKPVTITPDQRQLLLKHRELLMNVAISGVEIGMKSVDLAGDAIGEAVKGIFNGEADQVEKKVEAKAKKIEESAERLCDQLPLLMESQEKLAESLPEFKPYATMSADDVKECHGEIHQRK